MSDRIVKRVLVMLDYGPQDPDSGEVFDLTALTEEMAAGAKFNRADITLRVAAAPIYNYDRKADEPKEQTHRTSLTWGGDAGEWVVGASHLDDVVNATMPDGDRVERIKKAAQRAQKRHDQLKHDAMVAKLEQVAGVRFQHPIARVTETAKMLAEVTV